MTEDVKELFKELNVKCNAIELDLMEDGANYQDLLHEMTGQKTVPNVFINKKHIGGCDKTMKFQVKELFKELNVKCNAIELDLMEDGANYQDLLHEMTGQKTVPNVFINKKHIGGCDKTMKAHKDGVLQKLLGEGSEVFDYDLIVIGGGSGGLACSKEAAALGKKVMVLDYVVPTPKGTTWGLGGTCVNVGCIPKKLMHQTALLGTAVEDARKFGWEFSDQGESYIQHGRKYEALHGTQRLGLRSPNANIESFSDPPSRNGKIPVNDEEQTNVPHIYAIGDILEGKWELTPVAIQAGKLLCDYVNVPTTVFTPMEYGSCGYPEEKAVEIYGQENLEIYHSLFWPLEFTVPGRDNNRCYAKIICNKLDNCDYVNVPTTVFTPMEYGSCGYPEEKAVEIYGQENLEIYHSLFWPLEFTVPGRDNNRCYAKIICNKLDNERVIGFHYLGPNAGEVTQGFGAAMKCGITKDQLDNTIGIHPTCAEIFTTMEVTKSSGGDITQSGC
ncbi:thioredoxin reductase 3-like [Sinocyclocheilus grahami]|uniref:thioredoxin reductase 3-like n=1 Tax=Sinocyclocheilus grahami TaxID=75366 RepID=UPI0007AC6BD2|nr:PREDICTED: thioredoxin reductase 3-like [Sinocyclocheilus grahami]